MPAGISIPRQEGARQSHHARHRVQQRLVKVTAICQIHLHNRDTGRLRGKLSLVGLVESKQGNDTKSHDRQQRTESLDINMPLLALKECIWTINGGSGHVPYRQSKLTLILKDCFVSKSARTAMTTTLSPGSSLMDHTVNTLRYADRIKEKKVS